jgi:hypothetical protein
MWIDGWMDGWIDRQIDRIPAGALSFRSRIMFVIASC